MKADITMDVRIGDDLQRYIRMEAALDLILERCGDRWDPDLLEIAEIAEAGLEKVGDSRSFLG